MKVGTKKTELQEWMDQQYAKDPRLKQRVDELLNEMELEQDLVALRQARGLSQTTVAKLLGVTQPAVARLESEKIKTAQLTTLAKYVAVLGGRLKVEILPVRRKLVGLKRAAKK